MGGHKGIKGLGMASILSLLSGLQVVAREPGLSGSLLVGNSSMGSAHSRRSGQEAGQWETAGREASATSSEPEKPRTGQSTRQSQLLLRSHLR